MSSSRKEIKTWTRESRIEQQSFLSYSRHTSSAQSIGGEKATETEKFSSHLGDPLRRLSVPVTTDTQSFQGPRYSLGYQSPFQTRIGPFASLRQNSNRPSVSVTTDTRPFQEPKYSLGYQSSFQTRSGPFTSLRENRNQNTATTNGRQQEPRNATTSLSNISHRTAASLEPVETTESQIAGVPTYNIIGKAKGKVLIINIKKFLTIKEERNGSENDLNGLKKLFKDYMGFHVTTHTDLKANDILKKIDEFKSDKSLAKYDISIVVLMSHGSNLVEKQEIRGGFTQIFGADGKAVVTEDILSKFTANQCPGMSGKPKIFIFQCCRGERFESVVTDAPKSAANMHGDMLIAYSTLPGFSSFRSEVKGSWYIQSLCKVFKDHASKYHVENLLQIVHEDLNNNHPEYKQTSTYENRGFKLCYLQRSK